MEENGVVAKYIPKFICDMITTRYYAKIPHEVDFDHIIHNEDFIKMPVKHVFLFGDHGYHHVMNVAEQIPAILNSIKGIYIPQRKQNRFDFMERYGVVLGFLHDIGMSDVSLFGRQMHGEFVAKEVFLPGFKKIFSAMWEENVGNIPWTLLYMHHLGWLKQEPEIVFREMLSLAVCHRKQLVPVSVLNDPLKLQQKMQYFIKHTLKYQFLVKEVERLSADLEKAKRKETAEIAKIQEKLTKVQEQLAALPQQEIEDTVIIPELQGLYANFATDAFAWLQSNNTWVQELVDDVIDTLRAIRCSDAFRQRGTDLKTSAQFQIFVDQFTADAIYALSDKDGRMYFLELGDPISSGEANLASVCFTKEGDIRFEFHRGYFHTKEAMNKGADYLALLVSQLDYDVSDTFNRDTNEQDAFKPLKRPKLLLENTDDDPEFTQLLVQKLFSVKAELHETVEVVPSLKYITANEYKYYVNGEIVSWNDAERNEFLKKIAASGHKITHIDISKAFLHARLITVAQREVLFEAKTFSGFVYFPFTNGLKGYPTGSYSPFKVAPFTPLGNTGVIRGDVRNATIVAKSEVKLLVIPKEDYLKYWYATYSKDEFVQLIKDGVIK